MVFGNMGRDRAMNYGGEGEDGDRARDY